MKPRSIYLAGLLVGSTLQAATMTFDGSVTYQTIDGFGANINHRSWNNDELKPVIDGLVDQAGMTLFRVIYDKTDWEATNDNADPNVMNWAYYNQVYSSAEFGKMWGLVAYLNQKGISNGVMFNFQGNGPAWLGSPLLKTGMEAEWTEMVGSLLIYARQTNHLQFGLVGPDNEMDQAVQGVNMAASQYVTALHDLSQLLDANGMSDLQFVGPDLAFTGTSYTSQMMADPVVMAKVAHFGVHSYSDGGGGSAGVYSYIQGSAYPNRNFWVTEFNVSCPPCDSGVMGTYDWSYCKGTAEYLMQHLLNNASAGMVWEGYDSQYNYYSPLEWSFWGLFGVDNPSAAVKTYTPRKNFCTLAQISKWVRPGAQRIGVSGSVASLSPLLAFKHAGLGQITIVGINTSSSAATLSGALASLPTVPHLDLYYTSATANLASGGSVAVNNGAFSATIPADCVFTLTGISGVNVALTSPVNGSQFTAPAAIPLAATATTTTGSIALVGFYNGVTELVEAPGAPYQFTWTNVPMGDYTLTARATDTAANAGTSAPVNVTVVGPVAQVQVTPVTASVAPGNSQQFVAVARDTFGHALDPQPAFSWSVGGGGTIDNMGFFRAGSDVGGPFAVQASSSGLSGLAAVSVVAFNGGTLGNTNEGTATDTIWDGGPWINASGFQATSNLTLASIHAKVAAIPGRYKCAIYADNGSGPNAFLRGTAEVNNPAEGWSVFTLTSPLALASGQYYWLAIWSDDANNARVYYSDTGGTLQWGRYDYGVWPDPLVTTGVGVFDYCIYASGPALVPVPPVIALQPQNQVVNLGSNAIFAVSAAGDLPLSYQWYHNSTNALAEGTNNFLLLAGVGDGDAGWYSVSVSNLAGTVLSSNAQLVVNHLPMPASPTLPRYWGSGFKAPESVFLGTDPDGDRLFLSSISPSSVHGAVLSAAGGWVSYTPPAGLTNDDAFDYMVGDGRGGFSAGTAIVVVLTNRGPSLTAVWEIGGAEAIRLIGSGIPYRSYAVEFAERFGEGWQPIGAVMSDELGVFTYVESQSPGVSNRFYRVTTY